MNIDHKAAKPFLERLGKIYTDMDQAYGRAANHYGFHCSGCAESCCLTRFYHHTYSEYFYILEAWRTFSLEVRDMLKERAADAVRETAAAENSGTPVRVMCPLNKDGLCRIYEHRPMICRMHGIAHELRRPGNPVTYGPGCELFTAQTAGQDYFPFDRTPFYMEMARLESELKQAVGLTQKIKMTVAEMIGTF